MAVDTSYYLPVVDVPLQGLLEQAREARASRKWLTLLPVIFISAVVVAVVLFGIVMGADYLLNSAADIHTSL
jgi:hypothetical protein